MARPEVIANPADDRDFVETVRRLARDVDDHRALESRLRTSYPQARVQHSVVSGSDGERWYVYRDGSWMGDGTRRVETAG